MNILIVGLVKNPQFMRLQEEGKKKGHLVDGCYSSDLAIKADKNKFKLILFEKDIESYDLIYFWTPGKRRWEWYTAAKYLNEKKGTVVVNYKTVDPKYKLYLTPAMNYLKQTRENIPFPKSAIIFSSKMIDEVIQGFEFPLILKASIGRQGKGVFKVESISELRKLVDELIETSPSVVIREFIPNDGDIRVFTVGYSAIGAMKRTPVRKGEFRSNISLGGKGEKCELDKYPNIKEIAEKMSNITATEIAGVDIMINKDSGKPYVLEINPGPQFSGFEKYTGVNAALEIIKYFEKLKK